MRKAVKKAIDKNGASVQLAELNEALGQGREVSPTKLGVTITAPNFPTLEVSIVGTAPYCQNRWSVKALDKIRETQEAGSTSRKGSKREPKDFERAFQEAQYLSRPTKQHPKGWHGIPAASFRKAMISACRVAHFKMTIGKLAVFIVPDGFDARTGTPLVRINGPSPVMRIHPVRNDNGSADLRARPFFDEWSANIKIRYDADMFTAQDVINLLHRAGIQVGVGEGRPDSKDSSGMDWGTFTIGEDGE